MSFTEKQLLDSLPNLRAFAMSLCGNLATAEDLAQEACARAWQARESFEQGTNFKAWLFTILRNFYFSELRKSKREVLMEDNVLAQMMHVKPNQEDAVYLDDVHEALQKLPETQRKALLAAHYQGYSYEEASRLLRVPIGTIKSRVNRGHALLQAILNKDPSAENQEEAVEVAPKTARRIPVVPVPVLPPPRPRVAVKEEPKVLAIIPEISCPPKQRPAVANSRIRTTRWQPFVTAFVVAGVRVRSTVLKRIL